MYFFIKIKLHLELFYILIFLEYTSLVCRKVQIMLVRIPVHLPKMLCLRKLVKNMMRPLVFVPHFMMYVRVSFYEILPSNCRRLGSQPICRISARASCLEIVLEKCFSHEYIYINMIGKVALFLQISYVYIST